MPSENEPKKIGVPTPSFQIYWASAVLMIGLGGAVYPQVIQRIYAAKSVKTLQQSLGAMVFMPLATVLILFLLGVISIPHFADVEGVSKDTVLPEMLRFWGQSSSLAFGLTVMVIIGLLAAIMSTADSVLLSLSSIVAKDILGKSILKNAPEEQLTKAGKVFSWITMFIMVLVALQPQITLWGLIELKMQILSRGFAWLDTGTHDDLLAAANFISTIEKRQGLKVNCPEEVAYRNGWLSAEKLTEIAKPLRKSGYGEYLLNLINERVF